MLSPSQVSKNILHHSLFFLFFFKLLNETLWNPVDLRTRIIDIPLTPIHAGCYETLLKIRFPDPLIHPSPDLHSLKSSVNIFILLPWGTAFNSSGIEGDLRSWWTKHSINFSIWGVILNALWPGTGAKLNSGAGDKG